MQPQITTLRTFIGSKDFDLSRAFYTDLGFEEKILRPDNLSLFSVGNCSFYLQNYYVKDWLGNTMFLLGVPDVHQWFAQVQQLGLDKKYPGVKLIPIVKEDWAEVCRLIDPSGALIHIAQFTQ